MRKLLLLAFAVLPFIARGQSNYFDYYGWFDDNPQATFNGRSENANIQIDADVSGLPKTIHALHLRVCDSNGRWSEPYTRYFIAQDPMAAATDIRYWFDDEKSSSNTIAATGAVDIDVSGLSVGLHQLHIQTSDAQRHSAYKTIYFCRIDGNKSKSISTRYWFDEQKSEYKQLTGSIVNIDVTSLNVGLHTLHIQSTDQNGQSDYAAYTFFRSRTSKVGTPKIRYWFDNEKAKYQVLQNSGVCEIDVNNLVEGIHEIHIQTYDSLMSMDEMSQYFYIMPKTAKNLTYLCVVDGKVVDKKTTTSETGLINWDIDVQSLAMGLHIASLQVLTDEGKASSVAERYFIREVAHSDVSNMKLYYIIDGDKTWSEACQYQNGVYQFNLDVDTLSTGVHQITYMMLTETGFATAQRSSVFYKIPKEIGVTDYAYWINENKDAKHSVSLDKKENPFSLIGLLPVETQSIRSSCFHFENKNSQPKIYAKNEIHFTFSDTYDKTTDISKQYVDPNVSEDVVVTKELTEASGKETFEVPDSNAIRWYSMECEKGDSIALKASQATTIQAFAPSGDEVYNVSGSSSVKNGGFHAHEYGTYYFAIHDVTSNSSDDISLSYQKIDRYAILAYTPNLFGVPSTGNINVEGNGFDEMVRVELCNKDTTIVTSSCHAKSNTDMTASFHFDEMEYGVYDFVVVFKDENGIEHEVSVPKAITIEATDGKPELAIEITGTSSFRTGTTTQMAIEITNKSNVAAFEVPYTLTIDCKGSHTNIDNFKFDVPIGTDDKDSMRVFLNHYYTEQDVNKIMECMYGDDDMALFLIYKDANSENEYLVGNFTMPYIGPKSTVRVPFTIGNAAHLHAAVKKNWSINNFIHGYDDSSSGSGSGSGSGSDSDGGSDSGSGSSSDGGSSSDSGGGSGSGSGSSSDGGSDSGSGSGSGSGSANSDECCVGWASECLVTVVESVVPLPPVIGEWEESCVSSHLRNATSKIFSDVFCNGEATDFSNSSNSSHSTTSEIVNAVFRCTVEKAAAIGGKAVLNTVLDYITKEVWGKAKKVVDITKDCFVRPVQTWVEGCGDDDDDDDDPTPYTPCDPNEIYGYLSPSGSKYVSDSISIVPYTIEFDNDTTSATAYASQVIVKDTLDGSIFNLGTYKPTGISIAGESYEVNGDPDFVTTIDLRPRLYCIVEVKGDYDSKKGIATWTFRSLDPMSMEPITDVNQGFLPVNNDGNGIGNVSYTVGLNSGLFDGTHIDNRASIVFDSNDAILTPTWTNIMDNVKPTSTIYNLEEVNDSICNLRFKGDDNRSGIWKYTLYVQDGLGSPWRELATDIAPDSVYTFKGFDCIDYGFCVLATDSAGNVEQKTLKAEVTKMASVVYGDANHDGKVNILDINAIISAICRDETVDGTDVNGDGKVDVIDVNTVIDTICGDK